MWDVFYGPLIFFLAVGVFIVWFANYTQRNGQPPRSNRALPNYLYAVEKAIIGYGAAMLQRIKRRFKKIIKVAAAIVRRIGDDLDKGGPIDPFNPL